MLKITSFVPQSTPEISVIIPTLNEEAYISDTIRRLSDTQVSYEVIVVDADSTDSTVEIAKHCGAKVIATSKASRAHQMNTGAQIAKAEIFCFLHADTLPPSRFLDKISDQVNSKRAEIGCFRYKFDTDRKSLQFNAWCTRIPLMMFRGGDQSLFITRKFFDKLNGFDESMVVMEDYDIIRRGRQFTKFQIVPDYMLVSARKYDHNSYVRVNLANFLVFSLFYLGVDSHRLKRLYYQLLRHPKE